MRSLRTTTIFFFFLLSVSSCGYSLIKDNMFQKVSFQTTDNVTIIGDFFSPPSASKAVLLFHMMPAEKSSFAELATALSKVGFATLAIDLRGHGESVAQNGKKLDYTKFNDSEHQASRLDVDASMNFLKEKGFNESVISFVGASIGANLSIDALYRYSGTNRAVLLSPGLDYRGVTTEIPAKSLADNQNVWIIASKGDSYSAESSTTLEKLSPSKIKTAIFDGIEHGTNLFKPHPKLLQQIVEFLKNA